MTDKQNRMLEISAFVTATILNYWLFDWHITLLAALAMITTDYLVNNFNNRNMEKKTYVIMVSEKFPLHHPRAGEPTEFEEKILSGEKKQTVRKNYSVWKKRESEINEGRAILSIRKWSGKAYRSKHQEIAQYNHIDVDFVQFADMDTLNSIQTTFIDILAEKDGLSLQDFKDWVRGSNNELEVIINF